MKTEYSQYILSTSEKYKFYGMGYLILCVIILLFYHNIFLSLAGGLLIVFLQRPYGEYLCNCRQQLLTQQFKDMLDVLSASVAAGRQMGEAMEEALADLESMYAEDTPLVQELQYMVENIQENRGREKELLISLARRSHSEDIQNFVEVYLVCRETGGNLQQVIGNAGEIIEEKMTIEREIKTLTVQKQFEAAIISTMPLGVIVLLNVFSPSYISVMYETFAGRILMTAALSGILGAFLLSRRLMTIEV